MKFPRLYILDEQGEPVAEPDVLKWSRWFDMANHHLGDHQCGPYRISTVFIGVDRQLIDGGPLHVFETMVFDKLRQIIEMKRYSTRSEALAGHAEMRAWMRERLN